jgi:diguanylate cyclase (GGDEF)-like protein
MTDDAPAAPHEGRPVSGPETPGGMAALIRVARRSAFALSLAGIILVGVVDYFTGFEIRVYALYFVPLCFGAWFGRGTGTTILTVLCAFTWALSNHLSGLRYDSPWTWPVNAGFNAVGFGTVGYLVGRLRSSLGRERIMSRTDHLTSLWNGRVLIERIEAEIARQKRTGRPFVLAYMDLDDFKSVNDRYGHSRGDLVLKDFGESIHSNSRSTDTAARVGGDEFALLLPETGIEEGRQVLERLHEKMSSVLAGAGPGTGVSIGAAAFDSPPVDALEAIKLADSLMYRAKHAGKNRMLITPAEEQGRGSVSLEDGDSALPPE